VDRTPVFEPCIGKDTVKHVLDAFDVGWLGMGASTQEFEQRIADYLGLDRRYKNRRAWEYDVVSEGYRNHLNNIMASIGISQIKRVDEFISSRRKDCKTHNDAFTGIEEMSTFYEPDNAAGIRWDNAVIDIDWPERLRCMAEKDWSYLDFVK
jgi:dTDP-4-amino-4,6-dideoxygalactose transaminase